MRALSGSDLGVTRDENYRVCEWAENGKRVVFSYARKGNGIAAHFACGKDSLRSVKTAINAFCDWAFWAYDWCRMIFAFIAVPSVERIVQKCGFHKLADVDKGVVYVRLPA